MADDVQPKRVLVVDDEPAVTIFLAEVLEKLGAGYILDIANSPGEALAKIRQFTYALVLTDYKMPGMNGLELAKAVRHFSPRTQVVLMTAYGTAELRDANKHPEIDGYVDKPFTMDQIREIVKRAVEHAGGGFALHSRTNAVEPPACRAEETLTAATSAPFAQPSVHQLSEAAVEGHAHTVRASVPETLEMPKVEARSVQPPVRETMGVSMAKTAARSVHKLLETLLSDTGARCALLLSSGGCPIDVVGQTYGLDIPALGALIAANFAAEAELSRLLGNKSFFQASHHEGSYCNIYSYGINKELLLTVIFGPESKPGAIWFFTKRAAATLATLVIDQPPTSRLEGDLVTEIGTRLNQLFAPSEHDLERDKPKPRPEPTAAETAPEAAKQRAAGPADLTASLDGS